MKPFKFFLITDTHYFAPSLGCYGEEYHNFMQFEQKCFADCFETEDQVEGMAAFLEKRKVKEFKNR